jgi:3-hydroxy-9,10-secoandrosta-1,3,5(10)-triene-9,17-dione monooxygenase
VDTRYRIDGAMICDMTLQAADDLVRNLGGSILPQGRLER